MTVFRAQLVKLDTQHDEGFYLSQRCLCAGAASHERAAGGAAGCELRQQTAGCQLCRHAAHGRPGAQALPPGARLRSQTLKQYPGPHVEALFLQLHSFCFEFSMWLVHSIVIPLSGQGCFRIQRRKCRVCSMYLFRAGSLAQSLDSLDVSGHARMQTRFVDLLS